MSEEKDNLWQLSHKKTIKTYEYIENLYVPNNFDKVEEKRFRNIVKDALSKDSANAMLETIGYVNHRARPKIYDWSTKK